MQPPILTPACLLTGRTSISFEEWALVTGFEAGMNRYSLRFIILAEPYSGILLLMIIKAYQTCEYMLFVTCTAQSLTKARACLVRHGPVFGLARLVYVDGMHIFHPKNPGLTISSGILYYIALFGTFKAPRQKFGLLIS